MVPDLPRANPQPPKQIAGDDAFFQSPEYKAFQEDSERMGGFSDVVHTSPYFGQMGDSRGVLQDAAYRKYKGIAEPEPIRFAGPPQTASGPGGIAGLLGNMVAPPNSSYGSSESDSFGSGGSNAGGGRENFGGGEAGSYRGSYYGGGG